MSGPEKNENYGKQHLTPAEDNSSHGRNVARNILYQLNPPDLL
jgi:hypothetical protein